MIADDKNHLQNLELAEHFGHALVESIAWVNYIERKNDAFGIDVSRRVRQRQSKDEIRQILANICAKTRQSPLSLRTLNAWPDLAAQELVTAAVKGWIMWNCPGAGWLRGVRLVVKFEGVDQPYAQEAKPNLATLMKEQLTGHGLVWQKSLGGADEALN